MMEHEGEGESGDMFSPSESGKYMLHKDAWQGLLSRG